MEARSEQNTDGGTALASEASPLRIGNGKKFAGNQPQSSFLLGR